MTRTATIAIEHLTITCNQPFEASRKTLETALPRFDAGITTLLRFGESERALRELEAGPNLCIFSSRDHGSLLVIAGQRRRAIQYEIGNPLTASQAPTRNNRFGSLTLAAGRML
jgi:hypothetical protein